MRFLLPGCCLLRAAVACVTGDARDAVFFAVADPTRRDLVRRLVVDDPHTATDLARGLPMTRQAVVRATPEPLAEAVAWMLDAGARWDRRLERLRSHVEAKSSIRTSDFDRFAARSAG